MFNVGNKHLATIAGAAVLLATSWGAHAGLITPISATSSTSGTDLYSATNLVNDSGLSDQPGTPSSTHGPANASNSWVTRNNGSNDYFAGLPIPILTFDLGGTFLLRNIYVWNYNLQNNGFRAPNTANDNQAKEISVTFGLSGVFSGPTVINIAQDSGSVEAQLFSIGNVTADTVKFEVTDNYFNTSTPFGGGDRVGLSEVKFGGDVPAPATLALIGLGLAGLGFSHRKKA